MDTSFMFYSVNIMYMQPYQELLQKILLRKLNTVFIIIIIIIITSSRRNGYKQYITVMMNKKHNRERHKPFILSILK